MMTRQKSLFPFVFLFFLAILVLICGMFSFFSIALHQKSKSVSQPVISEPLTVILDAGHGGEDGGAISTSGIYEKDLNLDIAFRVRELLESAGVKVIMTRETDVLLYDKSVDYQGRKKALDLAARRKIADDNPDAIFVSIHMNAFPQPQYHGLQVWYSPNHDFSKSLADQLQNTVKNTIQPDNNRRTKEAGSSIYLLHHIQSPAVLIECGFLSNLEEAAQLNKEEYREQLAFLIFLSIMEANA